jgi:hypothetical protein
MELFPVDIGIKLLSGEVKDLPRITENLPAAQERAVANQRNALPWNPVIHLVWHIGSHQSICGSGLSSGLSRNLDRRSREQSLASLRPVPGGMLVIEGGFGEFSFDGGDHFAIGDSAVSGNGFYNDLFDGALGFLFPLLILCCGRLAYGLFVVLGLALCFLLFSHRFLLSWSGLIAAPNERIVSGLLVKAQEKT